MKSKQIIVFLAIFLPALSLQGQAFDGGILGGLSVNQIDGDTYGGYNKAGVVAGAWINTATGGKSKIRMELRFFTKGAAPKASLEEPSYPRTRLSYVDLPLLWERKLSRRVTSQLGLAGGYLMKAQEDINGNGWLPVENNPFHAFEISGQAGISLLLIEHFMFGLRWSYSLLPVRQNPGNPVRYFDRGQYNNSLAFTLSYTLNRRK
ncbi:MAG: outer membrane beta-barrel protein [Bacteroidales bacterium]